PKAPLYFLSVFTLVITPMTPLWQILVLGGWMMLLQFGWFALVTLMLSRPAMRARFQAVGHWVDRGLGAVMLSFGIGLLFSDTSTTDR
ncbi:MAG: LysE family transporter, partial [Marinobacterium sp.]